MIEPEDIGRWAGLDTVTATAIGVIGQVVSGSFGVSPAASREVALAIADRLYLKGIEFSLSRAKPHAKSE